jgi:hypothetical protein
MEQLAAGYDLWGSARSTYAANPCHSDQYGISRAYPGRNKGGKYKSFLEPWEKLFSGSEAQPPTSPQAHPHPPIRVLARDVTSFTFKDVARGVATHIHHSWISSRTHYLNSSAPALRRHVPIGLLCR